MNRERMQEEGSGKLTDQQLEQSNGGVFRRSSNPNAREAKGSPSDGTGGPSDSPTEFYVAEDFMP